MCSDELLPIRNAPKFGRGNLKDEQTLANFVF